MSHSSESHGTHDLNVPMSDPSMTGDLVERLRAGSVALAKYTPFSAASMSEAASLITKQAARIAVLEAALRPFAQGADAYEPDDGDGSYHAWQTPFKIADLRAARNALVTP